MDKEVLRILVVKRSFKEKVTVVLGFEGLDFGKQRVVKHFKQMNSRDKDRDRSMLGVFEENE